LSPAPSAAASAGKVKNIAEGKTCLAGDPKSTYAAGMYCEPTGMETQKGDTYSSPGLCMQQKTAGQSCSLDNQNECAAPLKCVADSTSAGGSTDYLASLSSPKHCR